MQLRRLWCDVTFVIHLTGSELASVIVVLLQHSDAVWSPERVFSILTAYKQLFSYILWSQSFLQLIMKYISVMILFPQTRDLHVVGSDNTFMNTYLASNKVMVCGVLSWV